MASIHARAPRKDGTIPYVLKWRDPDSSKAMDTATFDTKQEAEKWKRLLDANGQSLRLAEAVEVDLELQGPTVRELMLDHISLLTGVGQYQLNRYEKSVDLHFGGQFGDRKAAGVKHEDIVRWIRYMQDKDLSAKTIANHHGLLSASFETAVRQEIRTNNPCKGVKLPKSDATEDVMRFMTQKEWAEIISNMDPHFVPFFQLLIGTGLRFGEATALMATDFKLDVAVPEVRVTKAWKSDGNGGYFIGPPKTRKSVRTVSLAPSTVAAIRGAVEGAGKGYVFTLKEGGVMRSGSTHNRAWRPALLKAGYKPWTKTDPGNMPRVHDTRHSHASWMLQAGMEVFALSRRLGHESVTTTADRYSHIMPQAHFTGAAVAAKALEG